MVLMLRRAWPAAALWLGLMLATGAAAQSPAVPDLVLRGGQILTGDPTLPMVEALAIMDGRILAIGSNTEIDALTGPMTRIIALEGRAVIPGINDAHDHIGDTPFGVEATTATPPMADPPLTELVEAVRVAAGAAPEGDWIRVVVGRTIMGDPRATLSAVTAAAGDHAVLLSAWWGHGVLVTPSGLDRLGLGPATVDHPGGRHDRDAEGRLTGKLEEYAGWSVLQRLHSETGDGAARDHLRAYSLRRLAEGVTSVQVMAGYQTPARFMAALDAAPPALRLRVVAFPMPDADGDGTAVWSALPQTPGDRLTRSGVKWIFDGTPVEQLAFQTRPYPDRPDWYGRPNFSPGEMREKLQAALDSGEPLLLHVVGDAMAEAVLDLMEALAPAERWAPLRVRIEHANGLTGDRVARARRLGIVIAQPRPTSPIRTWVEAGIPVAYGSDSGFPPFVAFAQMTDPANPNGVSREVGLAILTQGPAFAEFAELQKGRLLPGQLADLAVLSQDPLTAPQARLPATRSLLTIIGGDIVHAAAPFAVP